MIIKSFYAESAAAALKKVRQELGGDAIVLKTRQLPYGKPGNRFEVTACREQEAGTSVGTVTAQSDMDAREIAVQNAETTNHVGLSASRLDGAHVKQLTEALAKRLDLLDKKLSLLTDGGKVETSDSSVLASLRTYLEMGDVPSSLCEELLTDVSEGIGETSDFTGRLRNTVAERFLENSKATFSCKAGDRILVLGAPGSGKSSFLAKLAVSLTTDQRLPVTLASIDSQKLGAHEELATYADILNVPCAEESGEAIDLGRYKKQVLLIDSPGLDLRPDTAATVRSGIARYKPTHRVLVVPAVLRSSDAVDFARRMSMFDPTQIGITMCDLTRRFGGVLAVAEACACPISGYTDRPGGMGRLQSPDAMFFANGIVPEGDAE